MELSDIMATMNNHIIIIGGGASALMLASLLPKNSATIIESNSKIGMKILISGGGKCNITNVNMKPYQFYTTWVMFFVSNELLSLL